MAYFLVMSIQEILRSKYSASYLAGLRKGYFDESRSKFFAYTIIPVDKPEFEEILPFIKDKSFSYSHSTLDGKNFIVDNDDGTYSYKDLEQLVREGIFKFVALRFYGILYERDWFLMDEMSFYVENNEAIIANELDESIYQMDDFWNIQLFAAVPEFRSDVDYNAMNALLSKQLNQEIDVKKDWEHLRSYMEILSPQAIPLKDARQWSSYREFIGQPWLVAYEKERIKQSVNRAYENYINEEIFVPFARSLMLQRPKEFHETRTLNHETHFPLIYPQSKEYVLCIICAVSFSGEGRLNYFVHVAKDKKIFEWTLPHPSNIRGYYGTVIIDDIAPLSSWGSEFDLHDSAVTMDDEHFWNDHVFKKENGVYLYLKPIEIQNGQPDIFTQW